MDKKRSILNVGISILFKILLLIGAILSRRFLIKYVGNEATGLFSLYTSIVGFLAVAELGVGSAITFCMYKPIVDGDETKVAALYHLFTKMYLIIGGIILVCGVIVMPFVPYLAKDYQQFDTSIWLTFFLMLVTTVLSYMFSSKTSVINAYKNNYITTIINSIGIILQYVAQIFVVRFTKSFELYLLCTIVSVLLQWFMTIIIFDKKYKKIRKIKATIDEDTKKLVVKNIKAMFMHKIGGVLVNTADSIIISAFIGVIILGKYSNYTTIMSSMISVIVLFFNPLTSIIGHLCIKNNLEDVKKYYNFFYIFNFIIGVIFFLGYYAIIDNLVTICFGPGLELNRSVSMVITINYFIQFMRQATLLFRDATGTFYYDRWKPLYEGLVNVALSIGFVYLFSWLLGADFAVVGVIVATIITNMTICHIVEPHVLFKYEFHTKTKNFYIKNYSCIFIFIISLVILNFCMISFENEWLELLVNGCIAVGIALVPCVALSIFDKDFKYYLVLMLKKIKNFKIKRNKNEI